MVVRTSVVVVALAAAVAVGCGGGGDVGTPDESPLTVADAVDAGDGPATVRGFLLADAAGARLCGSSLESFPPQCGEPSLRVEGVDVAALADAETEGAVSWVDDATLVGTLRDGALVVDGPDESVY